MPSGAKKRKAAKKKKQLQAKEPSFLSHTHGEEDLKHDDKESDSEGGGSPSSQDNQNRQNQFTEREIEKGDKQLYGSHDHSIHENEFNGVKNEGAQVEIVRNEDRRLVQVERELKVKGESEGQKKNVEYVEPVVESERGGLRRSSSSSSSSSNSSVEKHAVADKNDSVVDGAPAVELVKDNESLPDKVDIVVDSAPVVEVVKENESLPDTQVADSLVETASTSNLDKAAISEDIVQVTTSASDADNVTASTVEPVVKEKGEENLCVVDEKGTASDTVVENCEENLGAIVDKATVSEVLVETASEKRDEAASAVSNGNALANTDAKASATPENEAQIEAPHNAPEIDAGVCADNVKESPALHEHQVIKESPALHEHQLTALPPRPVQTTSWKGCCGLFELFAGSNR